ncbi:TPA: hypothetical protein ACRFDF_004223, partial [Yersinia enterocolitica]
VPAKALPLSWIGLPSFPFPLPVFICEVVELYVGSLVLPCLSLAFLYTLNTIFELFNIFATIITQYASFSSVYISHTEFC